MKRRSGSSVVHAAGWLFADLLLVITVIALGGQLTSPTAATRAAGEATSSPAPTTSVSSSPSPAVSAVQPGLDPNSEEFDVMGDAPGLLAKEPVAIRNIKNEVARGIRAYPGRKAALVIIWGTAGSCRNCPVTDNASRDYARAIGALLPTVSPAFFPAYHEEIIRGYRNTSGDRERGQATIELFFLRH